jgi:hypothetical protein
MQRFFRLGCQHPKKQSLKKSMTGYSTFLLLVLAGFSSCLKDKTTASRDCIEREVLVPGDLPINAPPIFDADPITEGQIDTIKILFANNNLAFYQYQYVYYIYNTLLGDSIQTQVTANPFLNGLPIFYDQQVFNFDNGVFSPSTSYLTVEVAASSDTTGHRSLSYLRSAFLQHVSEATISGGAADAKPFVPSASAYTDTCLSATLGYIDLSFIPGNSYSPGHVIKIWQVTALNSNYPAVFVRDDNGQGWGEPVFIP